jgi:tetratricopeptide (TPR) repeat protein
MATLIDRRGDTAKAVEYMKRAITLSKEAGVKELYARAIFKLGIYTSKTGNPKSTLGHFDKAIGITKEIGSYLLLDYLESKVEFLYSLGKLKEARTCNEEFFALCEKKGLGNYLFESKLFDARIDYASGRRERGEKKLRHMIMDYKDDKKEFVFEIYHCLYRLTDSDEYRKVALELARELLEETDNLMYQRRLKELGG